MVSENKEMLWSRNSDKAAGSSPLIMGSVFIGHPDSRHHLVLVLCMIFVNNVYTYTAGFTKHVHPNCIHKISIYINFD